MGPTSTQATEGLVDANCATARSASAGLVAAPVAGDPLPVDTSGRVDPTPANTTIRLDAASTTRRLPAGLESTPTNPVVPTPTPSLE